VRACSRAGADLHDREERIVTAAAAIVDGGQILRVVATALVAGIGISLVFSLVIWGAVGARAPPPPGPRRAAGAHGLLSALALLATLGAVAFGVSVMLSK
jgi:hypothetical protein